jgi:hypothetical protein
VALLVEQLTGPKYKSSGAARWQRLDDDHIHKLCINHRPVSPFNRLVYWSHWLAYATYLGGMNTSESLKS